MGFIYNSENPDFGVWIGGLIEYEDRSYTATDYEMIPEGTSYERHPIYTVRENKSKTIQTGYSKSLEIIFFNIENTNKDIRNEESFTLSKMMSAGSRDKSSKKITDRLWTGYVSYFDETDYFDEKTMPFLIDEILNYYPKENKSKTVIRFTNKTPKWLGRIDN